MAADDGSVEIRLARDLTFLDATMLGIGATVGTGVFVLLGFAAGAAGPAVVLALLLNGLVAGLTAATYADLGTTFPQAGGGYLWVREALPHPAAFVSGWMAWFGHMIVGAVGALGFGHYVAWGLARQGWLGPASRVGATILLALAVTSVFIAFAYAGSRRRRRGRGAVGLSKLAVLGAFVAFGAWAILRPPAADPGPLFAEGLTGVLAAMALTFIAFHGYEVIAQAGEEVREPERTIPRAMFLSLAVVAALYAAVAGVAVWASVPEPPATVSGWLGGLGPIAIVAVGGQVVPAVGVPLLAAGGVIATLALLNTTLFSASRLSFAMGRDAILPRRLGRVHPRFRAPSTAILLSGIVMLFLVFVQDLRILATTASLAFLLAFVLVNIALVRWKQNHPEVRRGFAAPLFPTLPVLGIAANLVLVGFIATQPLGQLAWTVAVLWLGAGLLLYFAYRGREAIARPLPKRVDVAQLLAAEARPVELERYRVLVPLREFTNAGLVRLGASFAHERGGEVSLMNVLEIPRSLPPKAIRFHYVDDRIKGLRKLERHARRFGVATRATVRIGHLPYEIVLRTVEEEHVNLLVLGWRGDRPAGERRILGTTIDYLVQRAPCDVVVARTRALKEDVRRVLLVPGSSDHAGGAAALAAVFAQGNGATITVVEVGGERPGSPAVGEALAAALRRANVAANVKRIASPNVADAVVAESAGYDLLVLGAGERWGLQRHAFGPVIDKIASGARCPVVLYRRGLRRTSGG